ncbi:hypothetical protein FB451DRAFT_1162541 [Mycena latifolia]|nr:hypothetical protein FB451DRAFT_1162541 [Mycena latifolia]
MPERPSGGSLGSAPPQLPIQSDGGTSHSLQPNGRDPATKTTIHHITKYSKNLDLSPLSAFNAFLLSTRECATRRSCSLRASRGRIPTWRRRWGAELFVAGAKRHAPTVFVAQRFALLSKGRLTLMSRTDFVIFIAGLVGMDSLLLDRIDIPSLARDSPQADLALMRSEALRASASRELSVLPRLWISVNISANAGGLLDMFAAQSRVPQAGQACYSIISASSKDLEGVSLIGGAVGRDSLHCSQEAQEGRHYITAKPAWLNIPPVRATNDARIICIAQIPLARRRYFVKASTTLTNIELTRVSSPVHIV